MDALFNLFAFLILLPFFAVPIVFLVNGMVAKDIDPIPGFSGICGVLLAIVMVVSAKSILVDGVAALIISLMIAFRPYALLQLARADFQEIDIEGLERAFEMIHKSPDSVPSYFEVARRLYALGLDGQAIAVGERTISGLSSALDPIRMQSVRGMFQREIYMVERWKRESTDPSLFQPIKCGSCGFMNPLGELSCQKCQSPYLLESLRHRNLKAEVMTKLILSFGLMGLFMMGGVVALLFLPSPISMISFLAALSLVGLITWHFFRRGVRSYDSVVDI